MTNEGLCKGRGQWAGFCAYSPQHLSTCSSAKVFSDLMIWSEYRPISLGIFFVISTVISGFLHNTASVAQRTDDARCPFHSNVATQHTLFLRVCFIYSACYSMSVSTYSLFHGALSSPVKHAYTQSEGKRHLHKHREIKLQTVLHFDYVTFRRGRSHTWQWCALQLVRQSWVTQWLLVEIWMLPLQTGFIIK